MLELELEKGISAASQEDDLFLQTEAGIEHTSQFVQNLKMNAGERVGNNQKQKYEKVAVLDNEPPQSKALSVASRGS